MKYIYDLLQLREEMKVKLPDFIGQQDKIDTLANCYQFDALLAIAERLEALVEAQKPRWVEFESGDTVDRPPVTVNANSSNLRVEYGSGTILVNGEFVKGTISELLSKLRGDA